MLISLKLHDKRQADSLCELFLQPHYREEKDGGTNLSTHLSSSHSEASLIFLVIALFHLPCLEDLSVQRARRWSGLGQIIIIVSKDKIFGIIRKVMRKKWHEVQKRKLKSESYYGALAVKLNLEVKVGVTSFSTVHRNVLCLGSGFANYHL